MNGDVIREINLCQPDKSRGCSVCCGLFNFQEITRENLENFLFKGKSREENLANYLCHEESYLVRDLSSHICPYQGFIGSNRPGCLIHPFIRKDELRDRSLFGSRVCDDFHCPAYHVLSLEEKNLLIEYVMDWYLYSVAILDPLSFRLILDYAVSISSGEKRAYLVNKGLNAHAVNLQKFRGAVFHYSVPEYNIGSSVYSLYHCESSRESVFFAMGTS